MEEPLDSEPVTRKGNVAYLDLPTLVDARERLFKQPWFDVSSQGRYGYLEGCWGFFVLFHSEETDVKMLIIGVQIDAVHVAHQLVCCTYWKYKKSEC